MRETNRFVRQKTPIRIKNRQLSLFKPTECECPDLFKIKCADNYCVRTKAAFLIIVAKSLNKNEAVIVGIKICEKHNKLLS